MNPRLFAVSGPLKDSIFALPPGEVPVGRDPSNLLSISDPALSRRHCVLVRDNQGYLVRDLDSRNGTQVNGLSVKESRLQHGDQISVGDSTFIMLLREDAEDGADTGVEFEEGQAQATAQFHPQDALYLQPDRLQREIPASSRIARNLNALLKISRIVHAIRDLEQLQAKIMALIFEVVPAERGAILLDGKGDNFTSVFARHKLASINQPVRVSRTITRQVLEENLAVLATDVRNSTGLREVPSLIASDARSLLCVPLSLFNRVTGCIYLDTTNPSARFDKEHLELVAAVAGVSAVALENARRLQQLEQENLRLLAEMNLQHNLVGDSPRMKEVYQLLARISTADSTVLIEGESGTGKELAARAIHRGSTRARMPFVAINCGAIPEGLLETELFGHERGSFTGAVTQKKGRFEIANGGVVFLDEIGEMSPALQVKLLRVLQEREFERVGGTRPMSVNIRLIAATNKDLQAAVKKGEFRQDLFFRLNVVAMKMPPLRERREDVSILADYFVRKYSKQASIRPRPIAPEAMACLKNYDWPGNVRELENIIERALVLGTTEEIRPEDLPETLLEQDAPPGMATAKYHAAVRERKKQLIIDALQEAKGNYTEAARLLGVHPNYLHRLIRNLGLRESLRAGQGPGSNGKSS